MHAVSTPRKSRHRPPKSRRRKVPVNSPPLHVHKRLLLERSASPVCNCSQLLCRLQTIINDPPSFHTADVQSLSANIFGSSTLSGSVQQSLKMEPPFIVESTASFDEAIVIDSDDSDDDLHSEPQPESTQFIQTLEAQQPQSSSFQHSESAKKPVDNTNAPLNVTIKVSLPLPKKFSTGNRLRPRQPQQRHDCKKSRRSKQGIKSKRRQKAINTMSADRKMSTCDSWTVRSSVVSDEVADIEPDTIMESVSNCCTDYHEGELQRSILSTEADADDTAELLEQTSMTPDLTPSTLGQPEVLRKNTKHDEVAVDLDRLEMSTNKNQPLDHFVEGVPRELLETGEATADAVEEDGDGLGEDSQHSATAINESFVEPTECELTEKTPTESDTPALDENHVSETASADVELSCFLPPPVLGDTRSLIHETEVYPPRPTEVSRAISAVSTDADDSNFSPTVPPVRLRLPLKYRSDSVSPPQSAEAVREKAGKIKKTTSRRRTYFRAPATTSTRKKSRKSPMYRKRCRAISERHQTRTGRSTTSLTSIDDVISVSKENSLISTEDDSLVQKCTETENVLLSIEQASTAAAAAESDTVDHCQQAASPCPEIVGLNEQSQELQETCRGLSVATTDQQDGSQVVTTQLPVSPVHQTEDDEVADFSVTSPPDPEWVKARCSNHEPAMYSDVALKNRLQGIRDLLLHILLLLRSQG